MKILVVDDQPKMRAAIASTLVRKLKGPLALYECANGMDAVKRYQELMPDWTLMDIEMEPVDGITAARTILGLDPKAKIILVTQYDEPGFRAVAKEIGICGFVCKTNLVGVIDVIGREDLDNPLTIP